MNDIKYGRKRKGIVAELNAKIEAWIETIDNDDVKVAVKKDTIITGGSIASMLLGEPVNDYDIYFRTKATTEIVAEYYVDKFIKLNYVNNNVYTPIVQEKQIVNCKGATEDRIVIYIKSSGVVSENGTTIDDVDTTAASFIMKSELPQDGERPKYRPVFLSANAITLSNDMQLVIRFYGEPDKIHDNFDFQHAMSYYDYGIKHLELPAAALECLLSRTLVYKGSLYPICSLFRLKKFLDRGWRITAGEQLKIAWQISELNLRDINTIVEQLCGCDIVYMHALIIALHGVDQDKINSTYISEIIDRIFS